jgi:Ca2+-binding RTX toxin-like protein
MTPCGVAPTSLQPINLQVLPGTEATLKLVDGEFWFGTTPERCEGFTPNNVSSITINQENGLSTSAGTTERLIIDHRGGLFAPGGTEADAFSEIEFTIDLGDPTDQVVIIGTEGDDVLTAGLNGVSLTTDNDVDLTFVQQYVLELRGVGGRNTLSGAGGRDTGSSYLGPLSAYAGDLGDTLYGGSGNDVLVGGAGADVLDGRVGNDVLEGAGGNDGLTGNVGDDQLTGGAGVDTMVANDGADTIRADDDEADTSISGGAGIDTAYYDAGVDVEPVAVETKIPA